MRKVIDNLKPWTLVPLVLSIWGFSFSLSEFIFNQMPVSIDPIKLKPCLLYRTSFLIQFLCVPLGFLFVMLLPRSLCFAHRHLKIDTTGMKKINDIITWPSIIFFIPVITSLASTKTSALYLDFLSCLLLYLLVTAFLLLFTWIESACKTLKINDCLETSLILSSITAYILKWHLAGITDGSFVFVILFTGSLVVGLPFVGTIIAARYFKRPFLCLFNRVYALFLIISFYYALSYFFTARFHIFPFLIYVSATTTGFLFLTRNMTLGTRKTLGLIQILSYRFVIPVIIFCFLQPLMFTSDADSYGNWDNVRHVTAKEAFLPSIRYLAKAHFFRDFVPVHGFGEVFFNALLLKTQNWDYAAIIRGKQCAYALGLVVFYFVIMFCARRKMVLPSFALGLASYFPFYIGYNNWDMLHRATFYLLTFVTAAGYIKYKKKYFLFLTGALAGCGVIQDWAFGPTGFASVAFLLVMINLGKEKLSAKWRSNFLLFAGLSLTLLPFFYYLFTKDALKDYFSTYLYWFAGNFDYNFTDNPSPVFWPRTTATFYQYLTMNIKPFLSFCLLAAFIHRLIRYRFDAFGKIMLLALVHDFLFMSLSYTATGDSGTYVFKAAFYSSMNLYLVISHFAPSRNYIKILGVVALLCLSPNIIYHSTAYKNHISDYYARTSLSESLIEKINYLILYDLKKQDQRFKNRQNEFLRTIVSSLPIDISSPAPYYPPFSKSTVISVVKEFNIKKFKSFKLGRVKTFRFSEDYGYGLSNKKWQEEIPSAYYLQSFNPAGVDPDKLSTILDVYGDLSLRTGPLQESQKEYSAPLSEHVFMDKIKILPDGSTMLFNITSRLPVILIKVGYPYIKSARAGSGILRVLIDGKPVHAYPTNDKNFAFILPSGTHAVSILNMACSTSFIIGFILKVLSCGILGLLFLNFTGSRFKTFRVNYG